MSSAKRRSVRNGGSSGSGFIEVAIRIRPLLSHENDGREALGVCVRKDPDRDGVFLERTGHMESALSSSFRGRPLSSRDGMVERRAFSFSNVLPEKSSQDTVYRALVEPLATAAMNG